MTEVINKGLTGTLILRDQALKEKDGARVIAVVIGADELTLMLTRSNVTPQKMVIDGILPDSVLVDVLYNKQLRALVCFFEHPGYKKVHFGERTPYITITRQTLKYSGVNDKSAGNDPTAPPK
jgi:hypothetical protein